MLELLLVLIAGHGLADFALQPSEMGKGKNRNRKVDLASIPPGQTPATVWPYWLTAHAAVHALVVYLFTGSILLACLEWAAHWIIDFFKCENVLSVHQDQALHIACKVLWVFLIMNGATS